ncbi:MAG: hypothetical protein H6742_18140 [Alphaproteobacteria bacterium]|nr:hypothetical protein [Alphaproteobacteria bacterium]
MYHDFLILGGAGLVGLQVCRHIVQQLDPRRIVVASLLPHEAAAACAQLRAEFGDRTAFVPESGNLFVPADLAHTARGDILASRDLRRQLLVDLYDDFDEGYERNHLVQLVRRHRPEVIVDCVNTATGLSYQDVFDGAAKVRDWISDDGFDKDGLPDLEAFLLSQSVPQLIRHVRFVHRATTEYKTSVYLKVGTTGTGGMGLNIPYTHSEDKPSKVLLAKNEAAFGHTGLMFLLARTPDAPIVKEVKPAAMIGYRGVQVKVASDKHRNSELVAPHTVELDGGLELRQDQATYERVGELEVPIVDTGENGVFTRGEFAAITALGQMEFITPEEIARTVVHEIRGANTGQDIISAMDGAVLNPSYKAGLLRRAALSDLAQVEEESGTPSVALGRLGPPELSKLLFEAHLLRFCYGSLDAVVAEGVTPESVAATLQGALEDSGVAKTAPSIGIPVLLADGRRILRGPRINVPEARGHTTAVKWKDPAELDGWVRRGWIDLRPRNMASWQARFRKMLQSRAALRHTGSAAANIHTWSADTFEIGEVVAWIFNNELQGYRVK